MKTLAIIWTAAIISGVTAFSYINTSINALLVKPTVTADSLQVKPVQHGSRIVVAAQEQGGSNIESYILEGQPVLQKVVRTYNPQAQQGGQGQDYELQPAAGYGALNYTLQ